METFKCFAIITIPKGDKGSTKKSDNGKKVEIILSPRIYLQTFLQKLHIKKRAILKIDNQVSCSIELVNENKKF